MSNAGKHELVLHVDDCGVSLQMVCLHDPADTTRPCWPWDTERDEPRPLPAPQEMCTYVDWNDNLSLEECIGPAVAIPVRLTRVDWSNGEGPIFELAPKDSRD